MIINHNINVMTACRYMTQNMNMLGKAIQRISSGLRINSAADDPAGLGISEGMKGQIRGLEQASRNVQDAISVIQVADGALNESDSILQRMKVLATQAANGTLSYVDRKSIQLEINQLTSEINNIANNTEFNTIKLLNGNDKSINELNIQIGANSCQMMGIQFEDMRANALGISGDYGESAISKDASVIAKFTQNGGVTNGSGNKLVEYALDVTAPKNASNSIKIYSDAIEKISSFRGRLGAAQNVLDYRVNYLNNTAENLMAAESRISDANIAEEIMEYSKYNILFQASQSLFSQANQQAKVIIELLRLL